MCYTEIMAVITPNTEIYLIKSPIELDNDNQLSFANATAQYNYFSSLPKVTLSNATYQRKDGYIRWPADADSIMHYNYCMYRNKNHGNKWFYAFITDIQYLSDGCSAVTIKQDVWQTWQFDITFKKCFVEREHVSDDTFGKHTIPEGLEYGEYISLNEGTLGSSYAYTDCYVVAQVSMLTDDAYNVWGSQERVYNGIPGGCWYLALFGDTRAHLYQNVCNMVRSYDNENKADAIVNMFIIPKSLVSVGGGGAAVSVAGNPGFDAYNITASDTAVNLATYTITRPSNLDGYTPKNNKMLCSPYSYLMITNNGGSDVCYAWEDFSSTPTFSENGALSNGCDIKLTPTNYKKCDAVSGNYVYSISRQKFPSVSWNSNFYLNWVAVNSKYQAVQAGLYTFNWLSNSLSAATSGNLAGGISATAGLAADVAAQAQQIKQAEMTPNSSKGNNNSGDLNYALGLNCFGYHKYTIKAEYAKVIDDYFTQFGYKVNSLKTPELSSRRYWNYVKTHGCNIVGDIPQEAIQEIKGFFNRGITIWHDPSRFLDYSQNNTIVS